MAQADRHATSAVFRKVCPSTSSPTSTTHNHPSSLFLIIRVTFVALSTSLVSLSSLSSVALVSFWDKSSCSQSLSCPFHLSHATFISLVSHSSLSCHFHVSAFCAVEIHVIAHSTHSLALVSFFSPTRCSERQDRLRYQEEMQLKLRRLPEGQPEMTQLCVRSRPVALSDI